MCAFLLVNKAVTWYISIISKCYTANSQFLFQLTVLHTINIKRSWCKDLIKIWFWGKQNSSWGNLDNAKLFIKLFILLYVKSESTLKEKKVWEENAMGLVMIEILQFCNFFSCNNLFSDLLLHVISATF